MLIRKVLFSAMLFIAFSGIHSFAQAKPDASLRTVDKKARKTIEKKRMTINWLISALYIAYFKRAPDFEGLKSWRDDINFRVKQGDDVLTVLKEISALFALHSVFISTYQHLDDEAFVKKIYRNILGNHGDAKGIEHWLKKLENGKSRSDMVAEFVEVALSAKVNGNNFPDLTPSELNLAQKRQDLFFNQVLVAYYFANQLQQLSNMANPDNVEQDPAYLAAQKILRNITSNRDSIILLMRLIERLRSKDNSIDQFLHDTFPPVITFKPSRKNITLVQGNTYQSPTVTAFDFIDGEVGVTVSGEVVSINQVGAYTTSYRAVDAAGNEAIKEFTVRVISKQVTPSPPPPPLPLPEQPQNVEALSGDKKLTISWDAVNNAVNYDICYSSSPITNAQSCTAENETLLEDASSPFEIQGLINNTEYYVVIIPKNASGKGTGSVTVTAAPVASPAVAENRGLLNDTGIYQCWDADDSNTLDCPQANTPRQDGDLGRDATEASNDDNDGHKGFSFIKLDANGVALASQSDDYTTTPWHCVKDKVTGFIWEVKSTDTASSHHKDKRYTWYNTDSSNNGGFEGVENTGVNTQAYISSVNAENFCGATDWRLPTREELRSIVSYDRVNPAIDTRYFPNRNRITNWYWSSSSYAKSDSIKVWSINFVNGANGAVNKNIYNSVRLVRSGQ